MNAVVFTPQPTNSKTPNRLTQGLVSLVIFDPGKLKSVVTIINICKITSSTQWLRAQTLRTLRLVRIASSYPNSYLSNEIKYGK